MRYHSAASLLAIAGPLAVHAASGSGHSTRYWDCCKPSCAWSGKAAVNSPVLTCDAKDNPLSSPDTTSGCDGGTAYTCTNNSPWAVNDNLAYGFAATAINGGTEASWCCGCYALTFTSGAVSGKTMVVQSTNTGGDISNNQFDILMPGGGTGLFDGCTPEFGGIPGAQYGGVSSVSDCDSMPELLKDGCKWRFNWFGNSDNPTFTFKQVQCPKAITAISGCTRDDDSSFPAFSGDTSSSDVVSVSSSSSSTTKTTKTTTKSVAAATSAASSSGATAALYAQCNGAVAQYPKALACASGSKCVYQNDWYSQCLPN
ncbi:hypothetical protein G7046_g7432 [Stylonectria norvegica]|nr:hypothetical protein G7046_g7432 [Stylonectria norvegica]